MSNFKELVRLGRDAEIRHTQAGKSVTGFSAVFDNGWGERKQPVWLDCSLWGERGEKLAPYLTKGSQIVVAGNIGTREHDGKTYITLDVTDVKLVGGKPDGEKSAQRTDKRQAVPAGDLDDELPPF